MKRRVLMLSMAATIAAAALAPAGAMAQTYKSEYKMSLVLGPAFPWGKGGEIWADLVRQRTNGRINIKLYPGTSLVAGDQTREFSAIRQGVIDMAIGSTINWSPQVRELNLFSLPFLMPDYKALDALTQGEVGKHLFATLEKAGVVPLAWGENGFREVSNSKREIRKPEDLKGLKLRVVGSPLYIDTFNALGANPTQMSWADAQPAMASGAVDGQENPQSVFAAAKLYTVGQKFVTTWGYVADPLIFVVNKQIWESWTPADREIVRQAAIDAGKQEVALARKGLAEPGAPAWKEMEAHGVKVTHLSPAEHDAFRKATAKVYDKWKKQIGADLVGKAEAAIAKR
ncbi:DctP family TRAP transporter solute-binding subunit [Cupriavidus gilardii]|uniref:DctP family TRAP transporter solute-binding subunit n=1 Tax=Cupriavidus gilardii TaxID=82541 RepID=A0A849BI71_9BURK|nr:DctP family TRAP transporter solute-binding subunit [Cupriavidus gilardii]KAB0594354.1 DctP family TRAP transporter solute-binding subunit [Cupriavidus gilardii]MCG5259812.1 DctP family TRAP transporter solute-binding subunit [Cupriavidus gilardii]MCT9015844.1 DctP family TRAP transporter solute-binding subunit [Cupriavidus gilardii]MCT9055408.1 DctP family TRAP transporter solute-binding subunit [Cupriavidus gilardii]MCT9127536.1 DctP family TRAP transporter solute-binding subunit [Cupriav